MKILSALFLILVSSVISQAATWEEIPSSKMSDAYYDWSPDPVPGYQAAIISAWSGGTVDTKENRLLVTGGGHTDYGGHEIYAFDFDTNTWSIVAQPENYDDLDADDCNYGLKTANGLPKAMHTYGGFNYIPYLNAVCDTGGSVGYKNCHDTPVMHCYDFDTSTWNFYDGGTESGQTFRLGLVHPGTGEWWMLGGNTSSSKVGKYMPSTDTWGYSKALNVTAWGHKNGFIDPVREKLMIFHDGNVYAYPMSEHGDSIRPEDFPVTTTGDTEVLDKTSNFGIVYDPVGDRGVAWIGRQDIYYLNLDTLVWTQETASGATAPASPQPNGTWGRFSYVPSLGKIVLVNSTTTNVFLLDLQEKANSKTPIQTLTLMSTETNSDTPFTLGLGFKKGDSAAPTLSINNYQIEIKKTWNDGSIKHAIASGRIPMTANTPATINVYAGGSQPSGTILTSSDIKAASPSASITLSGIGTVRLDDLLGQPDRIFLSGPEMVEGHYSADFADTDLVAKFHVRLYINGDIWVRAIVENGVVDDKAGEIKSYTPTVIIGNTTVYDNAGIVLSHYPHTRWATDGWIGVNDPKIAIAQDCNYLAASGLVPNYWKKNPDDTVLNELTQTYTPMQQGDWTAYMGAGGYQDQIGLLPKWDALYINSNGDSRAFDSVIANANSLNSYPIVWRDPSTEYPIILSSWVSWTILGDGGGGATNYSAGPLTWDVAHHGSAGYLAYLITGDYYYLETMEYQASLIYLVISSINGSGPSRLLKPGQTRGVAWTNRSIGQLVAIAPSDARVDDFRAFLANGIDHWHSILQNPNINEIGYFYTYSSAPGFQYGDRKDAPWQQHFWAQTLGYVSDLEPFANMDKWNAVRDHLFKAVVGILGPNGSDNYCYTKAATYTIEFSPVDDPKDPTLWHDSWGDVYEGTFGVPNTSCGNTLEGAPGRAAKNYWGNLLPAIAYAIEDSAIGSIAAWKRLTSASNWREIENSGFDENPVWGIVPRYVPNTGGDVLPPPSNLRLIMPKTN